MVRVPLVGATGIAVAVLASACMGTRQAAPPPPTTVAFARPAPSVPAQQRPRTALVSVTVVDGDTGEVLRDAHVSVAGAARRGIARGRVLFGLRHRALLRTTVWAPGYEARTLRLPFDRYRRLTVRLYRPDGQWPMYGADPSRTQSQPGIRVRPPFRIVWGRNLGTLLEFPASVYDGVAFISNLRGTLFALSMQTGKTLWKFDLRSWKQASSPAIVGDTVIAHTMSGRVWVLDRVRGRPLWSYQAAGAIESSPVVLDGVDYFGDWAGNVYALDLRRHRLRWAVRDGYKITASATLAGGTVYIGDYGGRLLALSARTGALRFAVSAGSPVYGASAAAAGRVFVPSRDAGALVAFSTAGRYLWRVSTGAYVYSAAAVWRGRVFFGSYSGVLYCVSARTGAILWTLGTGGRISGSPAVVDGIVYAGSFAHSITGVDARSGRVVFRFPHGEYVPLSGNRGRLLLYGWSSVWAVEPRRR